MIRGSSPKTNKEIFNFYCISQICYIENLISAFSSEAYSLIKRGKGHAMAMALVYSSIFNFLRAEGKNPFDPATKAPSRCLEGGEKGKVQK